MRFEEGFFKIFKFFDHENRILKLEFYLEDIFLLRWTQKFKQVTLTFTLKYYIRVGVLFV